MTGLALGMGVAGPGHKRFQSGQRAKPPVAARLGECEIESKVCPGFLGDVGCRVGPQDIDDWCRASGWVVITFKLVQQPPAAARAA